MGSIDNNSYKFMKGNECKNILFNKLKTFIDKHEHNICMSIIQIGNNAASSIYIKHKIKACEKLGITCNHIHYEFINENDLINNIIKLNNDDNVHGYIIQLPLPDHININNILAVIDPSKDIDCFHPENVGKLLNFDNILLYPPTPIGIIYLLKHYNIELKGKHIVIIGKGRIVGTPLCLLLSDENKIGATVTMCDKWTENINDITNKADILIVCAGVKKLINNEEQIKKNCVLVDVGIHQIIIDGKKKIIGDIDMNEGIVNKCNMISPSPGGCGCLTIIFLCINVVNAFCIKKNINRFTI
jgi:methylenetetrahydrofolate dehydrogenase (NADP+) / methenyltetrahydrofolate cyclohydrolase